MSYSAANSSPRKRSTRQQCFVSAAQHSLICQVIRQGSLQSVRKLFSVDRSYITCRLLDGQLPLQLAVDADRSEIVDYLLQNGAHINKPDQCGWTALHHAVYKGNIPLAKKLLERGADPAANGGNILPVDLAIPCDDEMVDVLQEAMERKRQYDHDYPLENVLERIGSTSEEDSTRYRLDRLVQ